MALPIIGADERLAQRKGIKGVIFGRSGIGKTSLLWTLNASTTLFIDLEAGDLAVEGLEIDTLRPRTWKECRDFAVFIGGPNPALREDQPYSQAHFDEVCGRYGNPAVIGKYETVFIDSITVAGRLCFQWCRGQPEATSEKTGKPDIRGAYGLHGREMIAWLTHLQHTRGKHVWFVGILDEKLDDFNRRIFLPQIDDQHVVVVQVCRQPRRRHQPIDARVPARVEVARNVRAPAVVIRVARGSANQCTNQQQRHQRSD